MVQSHKELIVWQRGIELVSSVYKMTYQLPHEEIYGISSQIRRASVSIPSNISEGYQRKNRKEYIQFLRIALGSAAELETQLIIIEKLYPKITTRDVGNKLVEVQKMLQAILKKLNPTP